MISLIIIILLAVWAIFLKPAQKTNVNDLPLRITEKLDQLWDVAQQSIKENKLLRAEKALLTILRVDEKSASAYNRLGIIYAKQKAFKEAIECFEIAQSLEPSASSLHNVGLIYYETKNYDKAALAFEQALSIDDQLSSRHIAYAKVQEQLGNKDKVVSSLERAVMLDPIPQTLNLLADAYERAGEIDKANKLREKIQRVMSSQLSSKRVTQPRRVVM